MSTDTNTAEHKLHNKWVLWYDPPQDPTVWKDLTEPILPFSTVEEFWRLINNIRPPTRLRDGSNYHLFKENVKPTWEDPINADGGKWSFFVPDNLPALWLFTVFLLFKSLHLYRCLDVLVKLWILIVKYVEL